MKKTKLDKTDFEMVMGYYLVQRDYGHLKYLFEISVPEKEADNFFRWIKSVEAVGLEFSLWLIERYDKYKLFYGFSDFSINENLRLKAFYFNFESAEVMKSNFYEWNKESTACYLPDELTEYLKDVKRAMKSE